MTFYDHVRDACSTLRTHIAREWRRRADKRNTAVCEAEWILEAEARRQRHPSMWNRDTQ